MRLVLRYHVTDDCTYNFDVVLPVEYESAEALLVDFEAKLKDAKYADWQKSDFTIAGHHFELWNFQNKHWKRPRKHQKTDSPEFNLPEIYTLDEWFERYKGRP